MEGAAVDGTNGADFSVFVGALFGAGVYLLLARHSVPTEADATRATAD